MLGAFGRLVLMYLYQCRCYLQAWLGVVACIFDPILAFTITNQISITASISSFPSHNLLIHLHSYIIHASRPQFLLCFLVHINLRKCSLIKFVESTSTGRQKNVLDDWVSTRKLVSHPCLSDFATKNLPVTLNVYFFDHSFMSYCKPSNGGWVFMGGHLVWI